MYHISHLLDRSFFLFLDPKNIPTWYRPPSGSFQACVSAGINYLIRHFFGIFRIIWCQIHQHIPGCHLSESLSVKKAPGRFPQVLTPAFVPRKTSMVQYVRLQYLKSRHQKNCREKKGLWRPLLQGHPDHSQFLPSTQYLPDPASSASASDTRSPGTGHKPQTRWG